MGKLFDLISHDSKCWEYSHIASESYYKAQLGYINEENNDFTTMVVCLMERKKLKPDQVRDYHEWISYYMHTQYLTELEKIYREQLAKRLSK